MAQPLNAAAPDSTVDYTGAHWHPSPTFTRQPRTVSIVVIHDTEGEYQPSIDWLCNLNGENPNSSAHYILRSSDGDVTQMVREADIAWHAGLWDPYNVDSIGIEHEGFQDDPARWYTPTMLAASARLVRDICIRHHIPMDRQHIIGHSEVRNPDGTYGGESHRTDPGIGWPWTTYMMLIAGGVSWNGHTVPEWAVTYWQQHGGLSIFGLPLTGQIAYPNGTQAVVFERARMEWHPEIVPHGSVLLGRTGYEAAHAIGVL